MQGGGASLSSLHASFGFSVHKAGWSETREKRGIFVWGCTTKGPEAERLSCGRTPLHRHTPTPQLHRTATHACTYPHPGGAFVGGSFHCGASGYKKRPYQGGVPGAAALSRSLLLSPEMSRKEMERGGAGGGWSVLQSARNACGCGRFPSKQGCQLRDRAIGGETSARGDPAHLDSLAVELFRSR